VPPTVPPISETRATDVPSNAFHDLVIACATPCGLRNAGTADQRKQAPGTAHRRAWSALTPARCHGHIGTDGRAFVLA
jgi:hypothetical protein